MTKTANAAVLVFLLVLSAGCGKNKFQQEVDNEALAVQLAREVVKEGNYELATTAEVKKLLDDKTGLVLIDAMPLDSFKQSHVPGAKQFLFSKDKQMEDWDTEQTGGKSKEDYERLLGEDKQKLIVVYCGYVKCLRSHNAALWAKKLGYDNVKRYAGGIYAWKGAGHATESGEAK